MSELVNLYAVILTASLQIFIQSLRTINYDTFRTQVPIPVLQQRWTFFRLLNYEIFWRHDEKLSRYRSR